MNKKYIQKCVACSALGSLKNTKIMCFICFHVNIAKRRASEAANLANVYMKTDYKIHNFSAF